MTAFWLGVVCGALFGGPLCMLAIVLVARKDG